MRIRPAEAADAAAVNELLQQLGYAQDGTASTAARIQEWSENPDGAAYVAEADGDLVGVIAVYISPFFERTGSWARIVALVVRDRVRGQGVGAQLVAAAEEFAADRGCVRMEVTSSDHRENAHKFYQGRGYTIQTGRSSRFLRDLPTTAS
jgi:GNAT superfamily N-acetyltransferase